MVLDCPVCLEYLGRNGGPVTLPCGHNGCLGCLTPIQANTAVCPCCRTEFDPHMPLKVNLELKEVIESQVREDRMRRAGSRKQLVKQPKAEVTVQNVVRGLVSIVVRTLLKRETQASSSQALIISRAAGSSNSNERSFTEDDDPWEELPSAPPLLTAWDGDHILRNSSVRDDMRFMRDILDHEPPEWLPDSSRSNCTKCEASFRPLTCGRHHCRFCGDVFCGACSRGRLLLPVRFREREPQRVCDACYQRLSSVQRILVAQVSNASRVATHDVTDATCMRSWLNSPVGLSMEQEIYKATNSLRSYAEAGRLKPEKAIPERVLRGARGIAILTIAKAGFVVTYKVGTGLMVVKRSDGSWSAPSAIACAGMGWGAQIGGELTDLIIVMRTPEAVRAFSGRLHFSIGAEMCVAAGPVGRYAEADVRAGDGGAAACYSYSLSKGAFVGISIEGSVVMRRCDTNAKFYGDSYITAAYILSDDYPPPKAAEPLYKALDHLCG